MNPRLYDFAQATVARLMHECSGARASGVENVPRDGPLIVACNHVSYLDPPATGLLLPAPHQLYGEEGALRYSGLGPAIRAVGAYPVDRQGSATSRDQALARGLAGRRRVGIFPEGTRNRSGDGRAADRRRAAGLAVAGARSCRPASSAATGRLRFGQMKVAFGAPLALAGRPESNARRFGEVYRRDHERNRRARGEHSVEIRKASVQGFCFGVAITVKKAEEAIASRGDVTTLGPRRAQSADGRVA